MNWTATIERYIAEGRTVSGGKGDKSAENTETSQAGFTKTLQGIFANNNANQQNQLNFLNNKLQSAITNPSGFSPTTMAALKTNAIENAATENKNVVQAVQAKEGVQGGPAALPSGVDEQLREQAAQTSASDLTKANNNIQIENGELQNQNEWNAIKSEEQVAGMENPEAFASTETGSAGTVGNLSQAVTAANGPTAGSILGGVVGAGLGAAGNIFKVGG